MTIYMMVVVFVIAANVSRRVGFFVRLIGIRQVVFQVWPVIVSWGILLSRKIIAAAAVVVPLMVVIIVWVLRPQGVVVMSLVSIA